MDREMWTFFVILGVIIGAICYGVYRLDKASCHAKSVSFEDVSHGVIQGCLVKHNGRWLPLDNIRGFDDKG